MSLQDAQTICLGRQRVLVLSARKAGGREGEVEGEPALAGFRFICINEIDILGSC